MKKTKIKPYIETKETKVLELMDHKYMQFFFGSAIILITSTIAYDTLLMWMKWWIYVIYGCFILAFIWSAIGMTITWRRLQNEIEKVNS